MTVTHQLKTWPDYFARVASGEKPFEVRRDDRGFQKDDLLRLREFHPMRQSYTGSEVTKKITFVLTGGQFGIEPGYVVLGLADPSPATLIVDPDAALIASSPSVNQFAVTIGSEVVVFEAAGRATLGGE